MPRIRPQEFVKAKAINKSLLALLPVCRDLNSARNELRWMEEHAVNVSRRLGQQNYGRLLTSLLRRRSLGEPLQYVLQSEYFGGLEIKCRHGVLIPRQETAASVSHLASLIAGSRHKPPHDEARKLRVLDLCTGTGCIPLLFHHEYFRFATPPQYQLELVGVDISPDALSLARENLIHRIADLAKNEKSSSPQRTRSLHSMGFVQADVLKNETTTVNEHETSTTAAPSLMQALERIHSPDEYPQFDILISNPPYISPNSFRSTTARSVRHFEPKLALVPRQPSSGVSDTEVGDLFYPKLIQLAEQLDAKVVLFEVADMEQASRVASRIVQTGCWTGVEIWRDDPRGRSATENAIMLDGQTVKLRGTGHGRSVFAYRSGALEWLDLDVFQRVSDTKWPDNP